MDLSKRQAMIEQYKRGYREVNDAIAGATETELDARPAPGKWTVREIIHHLADSEMTSAIRLRNLIATDNVAIAGYDQDVFARRLHYDRPIAASLAVFKAARETTAELLDRLDEADWKREGTHPEHGRYGMDTWLRVYSVHARDHAEQIRRARATAKTRG